MSARRGLVIRSQSGFYSVDTGEGVVEARLRGRLKRGRRKGDIVAPGDWVELSMLEDGKGMIEAVEPRQRALVRVAPRPSGTYEQIIVANLDQALFVFSCADPEPKLRMLDRLLVVAEQRDIPASIVASKVDLVGRRGAKKLFGHYAKIGYTVLYTSVKTGMGVRELRNAMKDKISVLAGPSGAGKSSLLNTIQPELGLRVAEIRKGTRKGRHTTVERQMFPLDVGGYVADTPGLKAFALWDIEPEEVDGYFREIAPLVMSCQYRNCSHTVEPGCAVRAAVESGEVHPARYDSYLRMRQGQEE